jgi:hypothetical protein
MQQYSALADIINSSAAFGGTSSASFGGTGTGVCVGGGVGGGGGIGSIGMNLKTTANRERLGRIPEDYDNTGS